MKSSIRRLTRSLASGALAAMLLAPVLSAGQEVTWVTSKDTSLPPPDAIAEPLRNLLFTGSADVRRGESLIRFWGVRALPVTGNTPEWSNVLPGTLLGAMHLEAPLPDIRGFPISPGVYTLRFALQPQDGDHMGVSPFRQFLIVAPAAEDRTPEPLGHDRAVALGRKTQGRSHPAVLSIAPPVVTQASGPQVVKTEDGHTAVVLGVDCTRDGTSVGRLTFGVVLVGRIEV
jgi:hypothetical protein